MKTRRCFLARTATVLAGTALIPSALVESAPVRRPSAPRRPGPIGLDRLTFESFAPLVDTAFVVRGSERLTTLLLVAADRMAPPPGDSPALDTFSLVFLHGTGPSLSQGTYSFSHSRIGEFEMFIVPVARAAPRQQYEAVFSRLRG